MKNLIDSINQIVRLTLSEQQTIRQFFTALHLRKGDLWIKEWATCKHIAFVDSGRLRVFYHDENGGEVTCFFADPLQFISSYTSFLTETPTLENIEAIEEVRLWSISKEKLEQLSQLVPKIQILRRVIAENLFIMMEKRIAMLQAKPAIERYREVMEENPDIILKVPLQDMASYLGITPQHLSRLRKDKQQGNL